MTAKELYCCGQCSETYSGTSCSRCVAQSSSETASTSPPKPQSEGPIKLPVEAGYEEDSGYWFVRIAEENYVGYLSKAEAEQIALALNAYPRLVEALNEAQATIAELSNGLFVELSMTGQNEFMKRSALLAELDAAQKEQGRG